MSARAAVLDMLMKMEKSGYSNIILDSRLDGSGLSPQDKRFAARLFYGVLERQLTLDSVLSEYSSKPVDKLSPEVRQVLRMAVFQLLYMDSVPDNAAVNESVELIKQTKKQGTSGFVNAVLRSFIRGGKTVKYPEDKAEMFSIKYSCPLWLVEQLLREYDEESVLSLLGVSVDSCKTAIRVNTLKTDAETLIECLASENINAVRAGIPENCLISDNIGSIENCSAFAEGLFHVQDISSQLCCMALEPKPDEVVLDVCAAPGGKTFTIAELMGGRGSIYALDLHKKRVDMIAGGAERLGITCVSALQSNSKEHNTVLPPADRILCDVPCSGLGVIGRKPEIKYKPKESLDGLPELQYEILSRSSEYLKKGGTLVYSTCSVSRAENDEVIARFLSEHEDFAGENFADTTLFGSGYSITMFPKDFGGDGFFIARLKRIR